MPLNGSGSYSAPASSWNPAVDNTDINSTDWAALLADLATALSTALYKDGQQTPTANIPMGGFKLTGLAAGTASGNSIRYEQVLGVVTTAGDLVYASGAGALTRLAIGTADQPLVVNSGATAPQWGFATKTANTVLAGPTTGSAAAPTFRALVGADGAGLVLIATAAASNSATIDFTSGITSTFDEYLITLSDVLPATNGVTLNLRVTEDATNFKAGASDYAHTRQTQADAGAAPNGTGSTGDTSIVLCGTIANTQGISGEVRFWNPAGTSRHKAFTGQFALQGSSTTVLLDIAAGMFILDNNAINGVRFLMSSGNITSGNFALYGVRKT